MESIVQSWLFLTCSCPLPVLLALASLYVYHSYKNRWSTVHVFVVCLTSVQLVNCILLFAYSLVFLFLRDAFPASVCSAFIWAFLTSRLLQVLILASMSVDRILYSQTRCRYRVSGNQVRYHVVFLFISSACVGMAGIFSRFYQPLSTTGDQQSRSCIVFSIQWAFPFAILFVLVLTLSFSTHVVYALYLCFHKMSSRYSSFARPLNQCSVVFASSLSCYAVHHLPYLIISIFILFILPISTPWLENGFAWLLLADALLLPFVLVFADKTHWEALKKTFRHPTLIRHSFAESCDTFQYVDELSEAKVIPRRIFDSNFTTKSTFEISTGVKDDNFIWPMFRGHGNKGISLSRAHQDNIIMQSVFTIDSYKNQNYMDDHSRTATGNSLVVNDFSDDDSSSICGSVAANEDFEFHCVRKSPLPTSVKRTGSVNSNTWTKSRNRLSLSLNDLDQIDLNENTNNPHKDFQSNLCVPLHEAASEGKLSENEKTSSLSPSRKNLYREDYNKIATKIGGNFIPFVTDADHLNNTNQMDYKKVFITKYL